jgi:hypothetical protein
MTDATRHENLKITEKVCYRIRQKYPASLISKDGSRYATRPMS